MTVTPVKAPKFTADQFQPSGYTSGTPAKKAAFTAAFGRLVASDYAPAKFTKAIYEGLHLHFGFIAHYNLPGFYDAQLSSVDRRAAFWRQIERECGRNWSHRPDLWDDVKLALSESGWVEAMAQESAHLADPRY